VTVLVNPYESGRRADKESQVGAAQHCPHASAA